MIPQRIELRTHPYQKYALPIKLRNQTSLYCKIYDILNKFKFLIKNQASLLKKIWIQNGQEHSDSNWESEVWSFKFYH